MAITLDNDRREQTVIGKEAALKKRIGDWVPDESIGRVLYLVDQKTLLRFRELLGDIPPEMVKLSDDIVVYAKSTLKKNLNDTTYISPTDHLYTALERKKQGIVIENLSLWDIKCSSPEEYEVGVNALKMVQKRVEMELSADEADSIALHLINTEMKEGVGNIYELARLTQETMDTVKYYSKVSFDEDSVYFYRSSTHLKSFCYRSSCQREVVENDDGEPYAVIKKRYLNAYHYVGKISLYLNENCDYQISNEERLYLTIHIARIAQTAEQ